MPRSALRFLTAACALRLAPLLTALAACADEPHAPAVDSTNPLQPASSPVMIDRFEIGQLPSQLTGRCLVSPLPADAEGQVALRIVVAEFALDEGPIEPAALAACRRCDLPHRQPLSAEVEASLAAAPEPPPAPGHGGRKTSDYACLCELTPLDQEGRALCREPPDSATKGDLLPHDPPLGPDEPSSLQSGWCYVDPAIAASDQEREAMADIVGKCLSDARHVVRFPEGIAFSELSSELHHPGVFFFSRP